MTVNLRIDMFAERRPSFSTLMAEQDVSIGSNTSRLLSLRMLDC